MANREDMLETFKQLTGMSDEKPFECVGSREEINFSIVQTIEKLETEKQPLPLLFSFYKTTDLYEEFSHKNNPLHTYYNEVNNLPEEFANIVRRECL